MTSLSAPIQTGNLVHGHLMTSRSDWILQIFLTNLTFYSMKWMKSDWLHSVCWMTIFVLLTLQLGTALIGELVSDSIRDS